ncbi:MAG: hypothetical protein Q9184_000879 [Pyrenodesmia sp. 2 TL-2023]
MPPSIAATLASSERYLEPEIHLPEHPADCSKDSSRLNYVLGIRISFTGLLRLHAAMQAQRLRPASRVVDVDPSLAVSWPPPWPRPRDDAKQAILSAMTIMLLTAIQFVALGSLALASPLKLRAQNVVTVTATTTVTVGSSPTPTTTTSFPTTSVAARTVSASASAGSDPKFPPEQCKEFCKTDNISYETCLSNCQVIDGNVQVNAPGVLFPPDGGPSSTPKEVPEQCKEFCKTDGWQKISYETCLSNCRVIDGNVQVNAPGVLFPPTDGGAAAASPLTSRQAAPEQCQEFCKTDKISYETCLSNCQVINDNVQVNAPGVLFPPAPSPSSTFTTSTTTAASPPVARATEESGSTSLGTLD